MCTIYYSSALGIRPRGSCSVSKNSMEAARKIKTVQFIFTSLPGELLGEGFTSYDVFFSFPPLIKSHFKMCQFFFFFAFYRVSLWRDPRFSVCHSPELPCDCSLMLI